MSLTEALRNIITNTKDKNKLSYLTGIAANADADTTTINSEKTFDGKRAACIGLAVKYLDKGKKILESNPETSQIKSKNQQAQHSDKNTTLKIEKIGDLYERDGLKIQEGNVEESLARVDPNHYYFGPKDLPINIFNVLKELLGNPKEIKFRFFDDREESLEFNEENALQILIRIGRVDAKNTTGRIDANHYLNCIDTIQTTQKCDRSCAIEILGHILQISHLIQNYYFTTSRITFKRGLIRSNAQFIQEFEKQKPGMIIGLAGLQFQKYNNSGWIGNIGPNSNELIQLMNQIVLQAFEMQDAKEINIQELIGAQNDWPSNLKNKKIALNGQYIYLDNFFQNFNERIKWPLQISIEKHEKYKIDKKIHFRYGGIGLGNYATIREDCDDRLCLKGIVVLAHIHGVVEWLTNLNNEDLKHTNIQLGSFSMPWLDRDIENINDTSLKEACATELDKLRELFNQKLPNVTFQHDTIVTLTPQLKDDELYEVIVPGADLLAMYGCERHESNIDTNVTTMDPLVYSATQNEIAYGPNPQDTRWPTTNDWLYADPIYNYVWKEPAQYLHKNQAKDIQAQAQKEGKNGQIQKNINLNQENILNQKQEKNTYEDTSIKKIIEIATQTYFHFFPRCRNTHIKDTLINEFITALIEFDTNQQDMVDVDYKSYVIETLLKIFSIHRGFRFPYQNTTSYDYFNERILTIKLQLRKALNDSKLPKSDDNISQELKNFKAYAAKYTNIANYLEIKEVESNNQFKM